MTLSDKVNNRCPNKKSGRMTELTEEEEKSLKFYIEYMASINHPLSIPAVKAFAWSIVKKSQRPNRFNAETGPGDKWYNNFKKRNDLTNRKPDNIARGRYRMTNFTVYEQHFTLLEKIINDLELAKKPEHIFNCDESWWLWTGALGKSLLVGKLNRLIQSPKGQETT